MGSSQLLEPKVILSVYLEMEFNIMDFVLCVNELECVWAVTVHETISIRSTSIREQKWDLVRGLWSQRDKVPKHVGVFQVSNRVSFLSMNERRKEDRVADEKDWSVVAHQIPDTIFGVKLYCETSWLFGLKQFNIKRYTNSLLRKF